MSGRGTGKRIVVEPVAAACPGGATDAQMEECQPDAFCVGRSGSSADFIERDDPVACPLLFSFGHQRQH